MGKGNHRNQHNRQQTKKKQQRHKLRNLNREIVEDLCRYMHEQGVVVHISASASTNTFYLKFDYGALFSLRVSNHISSDRTHNHRFNVVTESVFLPPRENGRAEKAGDPPSYFFNQHEIGELKRAIMDLRHSYLTTDGYYEKRVAERKAMFEKHREEKTNAFAVRSTQYDPRFPKERYLGMMNSTFNTL